MADTPDTLYRVQPQMDSSLVRELVEVGDIVPVERWCVESEGHCPNGHAQNCPEYLPSIGELLGMSDD